MRGGCPIGGPPEAILCRFVETVFRGTPVPVLTDCYQHGRSWAWLCQCARPRMNAFAKLCVLAEAE